MRDFEPITNYQFETLIALRRIATGADISMAGVSDDFERSFHDEFDEVIEAVNIAASTLADERPLHKLFLLKEAIDDIFRAVLCRIYRESGLN